MDLNPLIFKDSIDVMEILASTTDKPEEVQGRLKMSDGFELNYRQWKPRGEANKVVVCLHGTGGHSGLFRNIGPNLAIDGASVYAIDRRGFGNSVEAGYERGGVSRFDRYLQDTGESIDLIREINPGKKLFVFGKSLGCIHALRNAANKPDSIDGMILAAPPMVTTIKIPRKLIARVLLLLLFAPKTMIDALQYMPQETRESDELKILAEDPLCTQRFSLRYLNGLRSLLRTGMNKAPLVRTPTLIIQGDADREVDPAGAPKLLEALGAKDKVLKMFPGADHHFYDTLTSRLTSNHDRAKRTQVIDTVSEWMRAH